MTTVAIIDYGTGNLRSVAKAIEYVAPDCHVEVTSDPGVVAKAERIVFPGQGAMSSCLQELDARNLKDAILDAFIHKPFLGICLGLQILFENSAEGNARGLGIFTGDVVSMSPRELRTSQRLKVPHVGWNHVTPTMPHPLWAGIERGDCFYFTHSYYALPKEEALIAATTCYDRCFTSAVARANIFAVQFHPEKSARAGLVLLENFVRWEP